jgi:hypothetical protein
VVILPLELVILSLAVLLVKLGDFFPAQLVSVGVLVGQVSLAVVVWVAVGMAQAPPVHLEGPMVVEGEVQLLRT